MQKRSQRLKSLSTKLIINLQNTARNGGIFYQKTKKGIRKEPKEKNYKLQRSIYFIYIYLLNNILYIKIK